MIQNIIDYRKSNFKIRFFGSTFVLITLFKNKIVKFIGGYSPATRSYVIHSFILGLKLTGLPVCVVLLSQELHDKKYETLIL